MKKGFLFLGLGLLLAACTGGPAAEEMDDTALTSTASFVSSPDQDTATYIPLYIHDIPAAEELNSFTTALGSCRPAVVPRLDREEAILLTKSYWVVDGYADSEASRPQRMAAIGQWIRCNPDGTFTGGHWNEQTHFGTWYLNYSGKSARLTLDSNVDRMDAVWNMQAVKPPEMAWSRIPDSGFGPYHRAFSIHLMELYGKPTKEQFKGMLR